MSQPNFIPGQQANWNHEELERSDLSKSLIPQYGEGSFTIIDLGDEEQTDINNRFITIELADGRKPKIMGKFLIPE